VAAQSHCLLLPKIPAITMLTASATARRYIEIDQHEYREETFIDNFGMVKETKGYERKSIQHSRELSKFMVRIFLFMSTASQARQRARLARPSSSLC
jgi:hypothetical protein